jgi:hypothetical protein
MEQFLPYIWPFFQTAVVLVGIGIAYGALRGSIQLVGVDMRSYGARLDKVEAAVSTMQGLMVAMARQDERVAAMDRRMIAEGERIDSTTALIASTAQLIDGRMNAINNIVQGHTAQLNNMSRER